MVVAISEKDVSATLISSKVNTKTKMRPKGPIYNNHEGEDQKFQNITLEDESS